MNKWAEETIRWIARVLILLMFIQVVELLIVIAILKEVL